MRFLLFPPPQSDEWLGSWLVRLAEANLLSLRQVLSLLEIPSPDPVPYVGALQRLAEATYLSPEQILPMVVLPDTALKTIGSSKTAGIRPFLGVTFLQVCPQCLDTDPVPFIRRKWLLQDSVQCEIHGGPLLDRCPQCQRHLQLFRARKARVTSGLQAALDTRPSTITQCGICQATLTVSPVPLRLLPPVPEAPAR